MTGIRIIVAVALAAVLSAEAAAQEEWDERFRSPELPTPNVYRAATGRPGPQYWQQRADYEIDVTLDPETHVVSGSVTIAYANHSPDTLTFAWIQLDQNLFALGSKGSQAFPGEGRFGGAFSDGGYTIENVTTGGTSVRTRVEDTMMRIDLASPLVPGETVEIAMEYAFMVPPRGADRMGRDGDLHLLAQWFPRMAVYDDVDGWNTMPYLGQGEFYLEYGDYDVELTVPASWLVGATGTLQNPAEVLTATQRQRLAQAMTSDSVVTVVSEDELADPGSFRPGTGGTLTWRFRAENVRDFAWVTGPHLVWDATHAGEAAVHALYRPGAKAWREAAAMTRHSIEFYSDYLIPYPYPTATAVEGPVLGMEYPMVVFVEAQEDRETLFDVLDHEWGHMWFPMIVGTDERRYAWMDEGIDTFINQLSKKAFFPESEPVLQNTSQYAAAIRAFREQPIATGPDEFDPRGPALGVGAYIKPGVMLSALREYAGEEVFDEALAAFTGTWAYLHPKPADLFRFMEEWVGLDLGWFWHNWIYTTEISDVAILGVDQGQVEEGAWRVVATVDMRGELLMPARVTATTKSGVTSTVTIPVEAFYNTDRATATLALPEKAERITVNAGPGWGDVNPQNNEWKD